MGKQGNYIRTEEHRKLMSERFLGERHHSYGKVSPLKGRGKIHNDMNRVCPGCKGKKSCVSNLCKRCSTTGERNPMYRNGFPKCLDCGNIISRNGTRCKKCFGISNLGSSNPMWKGGITPLQKKIRNHFRYRQWRSDVFTRDDFTCQECDNVGGVLQSHHSIPLYKLIQKYEITNIGKALRCEELWNINNGITLCIKCHNKINNYSGEINSVSTTF